MLPNKVDLLPHEIAHYQKLVELASECTLFLKRDNDAFPIKKACRVALFGAGARHTLKGGTGSGDVNSHFFSSIEEELIDNGFEITTSKWLDAYEKAKDVYYKKFVDQIKQEAKEIGIGAPTYAVGQNPPEFEHDIPVEEYDGDICVYVIKRVCGEGADRRLIKGDIYLTDKEISDILYLNKKFDKFVLVINNSGIIDLSPVTKVKNILLLSQLGIATSKVFVNILLGINNPSGKLSDTWAAVKDYPEVTLKVDNDDTYYTDDIYVGYRYFLSKGVKTLFPFGFGLSYSKFELKLKDYIVSGDDITLKVNVKNDSDFDGKEVVQLYLDVDSSINTPKRTLVAFKKTDVIKAHENKDYEVSFKLSDFPIYNESKARYELPKGTYLISYGNSSVNQEPALIIDVDEDVVIRQVKNIKGATFDDAQKCDVKRNHNELKVPHVKLDKSSIKTVIVEYKDRYLVPVSDFIKGLSLDDLIHLNLGDYKTGMAGIIGQTGSLVPGSAGETTLRVKSIDTALSMADGPAGLRIMPKYKLSHKRTYHLQEDSIWRGIKDYLPSFFVRLMDVEKNNKKKGNVMYQYCTAIPIATALAQSYNPDLVYDIGRLVGEEMKIYDVDIWLAPGMNIHRSIRCGRNFEYYSEDPYLSGVISSSIVIGVQSIKGRLCCIKHYCCNNIETNRFNNNSIVSERALREIYLAGFEYVIKHANPACVMSSYNLVNGIHVSCNHDLLVKALRYEMGFKGLVMTDWIVTGQINIKSSKHPCKYAHQDLVNGVNICMPGSKKDIKDIKEALKEGKLSIEDLQNNAEIVYRFIRGEKLS